MKFLALGIQNLKPEEKPKSLSQCIEEAEATKEEKPPSIMVESVAENSNDKSSNENINEGYQIFETA